MLVAYNSLFFSWRNVRRYYKFDDRTVSEMDLRTICFYTFLSNKYILQFGH